jgi:hypothetical protein
MENDNKNKSNTRHMAICLLELHLTRANRAKKSERARALWLVIEMGRLSVEEAIETWVAKK